MIFKINLTYLCPLKNLVVSLFITPLIRSFLFTKMKTDELCININKFPLLTSCTEMVVFRPAPYLSTKQLSTSSTAPDVPFYLRAGIRRHQHFYSMTSYISPHHKTRDFRGFDERSLKRVVRGSAQCFLFSGCE